MVGIRFICRCGAFNNLLSRPFKISVNIFTFTLIFVYDQMTYKIFSSTWFYFVIV